MKKLARKAPLFDAKGLPSGAGVYRFFNQADEVVYVGKAVNLRRRLSQYLNARRIKKHEKMRSIVKGAVRMEFETCGSPVEAELLETRLIQKLRPVFNVVGAYHFMYPLFAVGVNEGRLTLCLTTSGERGMQYRFFGSFRSRQRCRDAFESLDELFGVVGHRETFTGVRAEYSSYRSYRRLNEDWAAKLAAFFKGESAALLEEIILALVEKPDARRRSKEIQSHLKVLKKFWNQEARRLKRVIDRCAWPTYPVAQEERDLLFIRNRALWIESTRKT